MGILIDLKTQERPRRNTIRKLGPAEVVLFTGVYYDRGARLGPAVEPGPQRPADPPKRMKRRRG